MLTGRALITSQGREVMMFIEEQPVYFTLPAFHEDPPFCGSNWLILVTFVDLVG